MSKRTTTYEERVQIIERHLKGESLKQISLALGFNIYCIRKWWRKYRTQGWPGLNTQLGRPAKGGFSSFDSLVKYVALRLKLENPGWGLDVIILHLGRRASLKGKQLPKRTTLHNYLQPYYHRFGNRPRYPTKRPEQSDNSPQEVHGRWQMDFKGYVKIEGVGKVSPFNICDEYSSAPLQSTIYSHPQAQPLTGVTWRDIQKVLRRTFERWGKPGELKMDRDPLFIGSTRFEWPSALILWLIGLGITPIINPRARPTKNANVERYNKTWLYHVGMTTKTYTVETLQAFTDQAWEDRRCFLSSRNRHCKNHPPMVALPELKHSKRYYDPITEKQDFEMDKVYKYLSQWSWKRQLDTHGRISVGGVQRAISKNHKGQIVRVSFVTPSNLFEVEDLEGKMLRQFAIPNISLDYLTRGGDFFELKQGGRL